jgi:hypothetical protein
MTLEEIKDKIASEIMWHGKSAGLKWDSLNQSDHSRLVNRVAELYRQDQTQFLGEQIVNQIAIIVKLRKALKEINEYTVTDDFDAVCELKRIALEALGE